MPHFRQKVLIVLLKLFLCGLHYLVVTLKGASSWHMSLVVRKTFFCICENKDADQLRGNREADQPLCFRYIDSTIPLLSKSKISSLTQSSVTAQPRLCRTWSETPKTGFLIVRLLLPVVYSDGCRSISPRKLQYIYLVTSSSLKTD